VVVGVPSQGELQGAPCLCLRAYLSDRMGDRIIRTDLSRRSFQTDSRFAASGCRDP